MKIFRSSTDEKIKYYFEGFGLKAGTIESGKSFPSSKGKLVSSLEVAIGQDGSYEQNEGFDRILEDCCPPEIVGQGVVASRGYIKAYEIYEGNNKLYVHTIKEE